MNKFSYLYILQGLYSKKWEDLMTSEKFSEVKNDKKAYQENEKGSYRIIKRRELNQ